MVCRRTPQCHQRSSAIHHRHAHHHGSLTSSAWTQRLSVPTALQQGFEIHTTLRNSSPARPSRCEKSPHAALLPGYHRHHGPCCLRDTASPHRSGALVATFNIAHCPVSSPPTHHRHPGANSFNTTSKVAGVNGLADSNTVPCAVCSHQYANPVIVADRFATLNRLSSFVVPVRVAPPERTSVVASKRRMQLRADLKLSLYSNLIFGHFDRGTRETCGNHRRRHRGPHYAIASANRLQVDVYERATELKESAPA